jgi:ribonuclease BN (tRNA processing enzyme)
MPVRLTVIGSSPAWPNPASAQSGYLLQGPGTLLLDCGPGVLAHLRAAGTADVDAIAITHFHLDHWGDLVPWAWLNMFGVASAGRPEVWLPPGGVGELARFAESWGNQGMFERAFELREFEPREPFRAGGFHVEARAVPHYKLRAFGFRVSADGKTIAYSGDSGPGGAIADLARDADLFLCEATLARGDLDGSPRGHLTADEALAAADSPVLFTHRPVELSEPRGGPVAYDGLVVEI